MRRSSLILAQASLVLCDASSDEAFVVSLPLQPQWTFVHGLQARRFRLPQLHLAGGGHSSNRSSTYSSGLTYSAKASRVCAFSRIQSRGSAS